MDGALTSYQSFLVKGSTLKENHKLIEMSIYSPNSCITRKSHANCCTIIADEIVLNLRHPWRYVDEFNNKKSTDISSRDKRGYFYLHLLLATLLASFGEPLVLADRHVWSC